jgi:hypothetical protein
MIGSRATFPCVGRALPRNTRLCTKSLVRNLTQRSTRTFWPHFGHLSGPESPTLARKSTAMEHFLCKAGIPHENAWKSMACDPTIASDIPCGGTDPGACGADPWQCPDREHPTAMWTYKFLRTKHFHRVSSGSPHPYLLQAGYGKVSI